MKGQVRSQFDCEKKIKLSHAAFRPYVSIDAGISCFTFFFLHPNSGKGFLFPFALCLLRTCLWWMIYFRSNYSRHPPLTRRYLCPVGRPSERATIRQSKNTRASHDRSSSLDTEAADSRLATTITRERVETICKHCILKRPRASSTV